MSETKKSAAVILAAGSGRRMNSKRAKQYLPLGGKPVLYYSLKAFTDSPIDEIVLVAGENELSYCRTEIVERYAFSKVKAVVAGGKERYHSVYEGLKAVRAADYVLIHDGARPLVTEEIIERAFAGAVEHEACVCAVPVKDTIKIADEQGFCESTPPREKLWQVQTPQAFSFPLIFGAYERLILEEEKRRDKNGSSSGTGERNADIGGAAYTVTDDAMVVELMCQTKVKLVAGSYENIKITTAEDLGIAESLLLDCGEGREK